MTQLGPSKEEKEKKVLHCGATFKYKVDKVNKVRIPCFACIFLLMLVQRSVFY